MIKALLLFIMFVCCNAYENLIWYRIPQFYVAESVNNFLNNREINNCYYKFEDDDPTWLLEFEYFKSQCLNGFMTNFSKDLWIYRELREIEKRV